MNEKLLNPNKQTRRTLFYVAKVAGSLVLEIEELKREPGHRARRGAESISASQAKSQTEGITRLMQKINPALGSVISLVGHPKISRQIDSPEDPLKPINVGRAAKKIEAATFSGALAIIATGTNRPVVGIFERREMWAVPDDNVSTPLQRFIVQSLPLEGSTEYKNWAKSVSNETK